MDEALRARQDAEREYERVQAQWPAIRHVVAELRRLQDANHFADAVRAALRGD